MKTRACHIGALVVSWCLILTPSTVSACSRFLVGGPPSRPSPTWTAVEGVVIDHRRTDGTVLGVSRPWAVVVEVRQAEPMAAASLLDVVLLGTEPDCAARSLETIELESLYPRGTHVITVADGIAEIGPERRWTVVQDLPAFGQLAPVPAGFPRRAPDADFTFQSAETPDRAYQTYEYARTLIRLPRMEQTRRVTILRDLAHYRGWADYSILEAYERDDVDADRISKRLLAETRKQFDALARWAGATRGQRRELRRVLDAVLESADARALAGSRK